MSDSVLERQSLSRDLVLEQLAASPEQFRRAIGDRSAEDLRAPSPDGNMSVVEILSHVQDWEEITGDRIARILHSELPELESYDDTLWCIEHDYASRDAWHQLEAFTTSRNALVDTLRQLSPHDWERSALLQDHGKVSILWLMERTIQHDAKHEQQIVDALR